MFILDVFQAVPISLGFVWYNKMIRQIRPFLFFMLVGLAADTLSAFIICNYHITNAWVMNLSNFAEAMLLFLQFKYWGLFKNHPQYNLTLFSLIFAGFILDNMVLKNFNLFSPYFKVIYSFLFVLLSINQMNYLIIREGGTIWKSYQFILCIAFLLRFIYDIIYEYAFFVSQPDPGTFHLIMTMQEIIKVLTFGIYALAMFRVPLRGKDYFEMMDSKRLNLTE